ncbi:MAG: histidine kinase [Byssovorax sp.]
MPADTSSPPPPLPVAGGPASPRLHLPDLEDLINDVLTTASLRRREVRDDAGRSYEVVVRPHVTLGDHQDGAVVTILDIGAMKVSRHAVTAAGIALALDDVTDAARPAKIHRSYEQKLEQLAFETAAAEERERRRIAADLHDRIGQTLALIDIKLNAARRTLSPGGDNDLDDCRRLVQQSIADVRAQTFELSPPILYDLGIKAAVSWLGDRMKHEHGLEVEVADDGQPKPLDETAAALLFRAIRELLMNVLKHAGTRAARVSLRREEGELSVEVKDEGAGFDTEHAPPSGGFGLFSVRERIARLGGSVEITSAPGQGTRVGIRLPVLASTHGAPRRTRDEDPAR